MRPIHLAGLLLLSLIWGASFMLIKVMLDEMSPVSVGWVRLGGGAAFILAVARIRGRPLPSDPGKWRDLGVIAVVGSAVPFILIPWGEREIPSNLAAVLNSATPLWTAILSTAFLPLERATPARMAGVALGFAGVVVVIGPDLRDLTSGTTQGQLAVLLAAMSYAAGAVYLRRHLLGVDSTVIAGVQSLLAFALLTPVVAADGFPHLLDAPARVQVAAAALAFLASGVALLIYYWLLSQVEATQAALVTYLAPVTAVFWGWLVLSEGIEASVIPGFALIVAGLFLVNRRARAAVGVAELAATRRARRS